MPPWGQGSEGGSGGATLQPLVHDAVDGDLELIDRSAGGPTEESGGEVEGLRLECADGNRCSTHRKLITTEQIGAGVDAAGWAGGRRRRSRREQCCQQGDGVRHIDPAVVVDIGCVVAGESIISIEEKTEQRHRIADIDEAVRRAIRTTGMAVSFTASTIVGGISLATTATLGPE